MREKMDKRMRILAALAGSYCGQASEDQLPQASLTFLREMWAKGLIEGVGDPDARWSNETSRETRVWWITEKGRGVLREKEQAKPAVATAWGSPLPHVMGHVPEIVVTPTPAQTPGDKE